MEKKGRFGEFGGQYVPETLMPVLKEVEEAYLAAQKDPETLKAARKDPEAQREPEPRKGKVNNDGTDDKPAPGKTGGNGQAEELPDGI